MCDKVSAFFAYLKNKRVSFIGLGVSHDDLIRLLVRKGIEVTVYDRRTREKIGAWADELSGMGVNLVLGPDYLSRLDGDIIFRTPGVYYNLPEITEAQARGIIVTSETELFMDLCPCPIAAVTGSDGKTTTTTLISEMLRAEGYRVHLGGNIGYPLLSRIEEITPDDWAVVELSSFQLISMRRSPRIAVVTNVAPNHLDVHRDMQEYIDAKKNIFTHQDGFSRTVLNADNQITKGFSPLIRGQKSMFSRRSPVEHGAWMDENGTLWYSDHSRQTRIMAAGEIRIPGLHNVENMLAAVCAVWGIVSVENICRVAREFGGVEHRIEFVRELDGVKWYNDSIASSPSRTIAGLKAFGRRIIIIAGGYDKKIPFEPLAPVAAEFVKTMILMGPTADKIQAAVTAYPGYHGDNPRILRAKDMEEAVQIARNAAEKGDIVSLSPACASFDAYPNFEVRGRHYKELVRAL